MKILPASPSLLAFPLSHPFVPSCLLNHTRSCFSQCAVDATPQIDMVINHMFDSIPCSAHNMAMCRYCPMSFSSSTSASHGLRARNHARNMIRLMWTLQFTLTDTSSTPPAKHGHAGPAVSAEGREGRARNLGACSLPFSDVHGDVAQQ